MYCLLIFMYGDSFGSKACLQQQLLNKKLHPKFVVLLTILADTALSGYIFLLIARPGGLEPPTSGFGDLRSTN